jgi:hypothetical protein
MSCKGKRAGKPDAISATARIVVTTAIWLAAGLACSVGRSPTPASDTPVVTLSSPQPGQTTQAGQPVVVQSTSMDPDGIQRVELWVDNTLTRVDANPRPGSPYIVAQAWQSTSLGPHTILVKAFDTQGAEGQSASIPSAFKSLAQAPASTPVAQGPTPPTARAHPTTSVPPTQTPTTPPRPGRRPQPYRSPALLANAGHQASSLQPTGIEVHTS